MQTTNNYIKGSRFERLMCNAYGISSGQGQKPEVTHAYHNLLHALEGRNCQRIKPEDHFQRVIGLLVGAIIVFRKRNRDERTDKKLLYIAAVLFQPLTEKQIAWAVDELGKLMPL